MLNPRMWVLSAAAAMVAAGLPRTAVGAKTDRLSDEVRIADFEGQLPEGMQLGNLQARIVAEPGAPASGGGCLRVQQLDNRQDAYVIFPLPAQMALSQRHKLTAWIRSSDSGRPIRMHWFALDGDNWVIFQRLFHCQDSPSWTKQEWPLAQWRWGNERAGEWAEVRALALRVESETAEIYLDDISLTEDLQTDAFREEILRKTAFPDRKSLLTIEEGMLVGTDALPGLSRDDLKESVAQGKRVRAWVQRTFGQSARPILDGPPTALLIFQKRSEYQSFFNRLGSYWNVQIPLPRSGGYTVQDIAACVHEPAGGHSQPVILHETVHAIVSRELRLLPGAPAHAWLQEGLANYLQLCVYPESLKAGELANHFRQPIGPRTFFRPLEELLGKPVRSCHYAQLASLVAWLVEERPEWLRQIASGLAVGKELPDIFHSLDTSLEEIERIWLDWGRRTYVESVSPPPPGRHFPLPTEWAPAADTPKA